MTKQVSEDGNSQDTQVAERATQTKNLYVSVKTFDSEGKTIGERIVDMYHYGTAKWLQNHLWWAMHNDHCVESQQGHRRGNRRLYVPAGAGASGQVFQDQGNGHGRGLNCAKRGTPEHVFKLLIPLIFQSLSGLCSR